MPGREPEQRLRDVLRSSRREVAYYLGAGAVYVAIGAAAVEFLFSWVVAAAYLLLAIVVLPALARRVR